MGDKVAGFILSLCCIIILVTIFYWLAYERDQVRGRDRAVTSEMERLGYERECTFSHFQPILVNKTIIQQPVYDCKWIK